MWETVLAFPLEKKINSDAPLSLLGIPTFEKLLHEKLLVSSQKIGVLR